MMQRGRTALMSAAAKGHIEVVNALLDKGADIQEIDKVMQRVWNRICIVMA